MRSLKKISKWEQDEIVVQQSKSIKRITFRNIFDNIAEFAMLHRGIPYTFKELTLRPGKVVHEYLFTERSKYTNPLRYLVIMALFVVITTQIELFLYPNEDSEPYDSQLEDFMGHFHYFLILLSFVYGLLSFLIFKKSEYNLAESLSYFFFFSGHYYAFIGISALIMLPVPPLDNERLDLLLSIPFIVVWPIYVFWALKDTFQLSFLQTFWRFMVIFVLSVIAGTPLIIAAIYVHDFIFNHIN